MQKPELPAATRWTAFTELTKSSRLSRSAPHTSTSDVRGYKTILFKKHTIASDYFSPFYLDQKTSPVSFKMSDMQLNLFINGQVRHNLDRRNKSETLK